MSQTFKQEQTAQSFHSGHDPKHGTLKASLSVLGNKLYDDLERDLHISILRTGAFVCAHDDIEEKFT